MNEIVNNALLSEVVVEGYNHAKTRRSNWENLWNECYDYAFDKIWTYGKLLNQSLKIMTY